MAGEQENPERVAAESGTETQLWAEKALGALKIVLANDLAKVGAVLMLMFVIMALFAPQIAPNDPEERITAEDGDWVKNADPSLQYPLGTTSSAYPIFSMLVYGTRIAFLVGLLTAVIVGVVGTFLGMIAGYNGGYVETIIMRLADTAYGLPFLPFAIALIMISGRGYLNIVIAISVILWRGTARVIRSEVVSMKEQQMIDAARASGARDRRIILRHIFPKVVPITLLYMVFAVGWAIMAEAGLSFIGFGSEDAISWGRILNNAQSQQALIEGHWIWITAPGLLIVMFVMSTYFLGQGIEEVVNPQLRQEE